MRIEQRSVSLFFVGALETRRQAGGGQANTKQLDVRAVLRKKLSEATHTQTYARISAGSFGTAVFDSAFAAYRRGFAWGNPPLRNSCVMLTPDVELFLAPVLFVSEDVERLWHIWPLGVCYMRRNWKRERKPNNCFWQWKMIQIQITFLSCDVTALQLWFTFYNRISL